MRPFTCSRCGQLLVFENSECLGCGSLLGVDPHTHQLLTLDDTPDGLVPHQGGGERFRRCANQVVARCNWLVHVGAPDALCESCRLTTVRPNDAETDALVAFADAETAKRRLLAQIGALGLPVAPRSRDPERGLSFELLSSRTCQVITGHDGGVITLDLSESDDAHRELVRQQLGEPYRTVLGHLRHEIGHYFWPHVVERAGLLDEFRALFGDERVSYEDAKAAHYRARHAQSWSSSHVSQYATMHPWEDWAETFAHYLHIHDGLHSADAFGLTVGSPSADAGDRGLRATGDLSIASMVRDWLALTVALNGMSRSIGEGDHYPFVLAETVVAKLDFVHRTVTAPRPT